MSTSNYFIADPNYTYYDGSTNSTANNQGYVCIAGSTLRITVDRTPSSSTDNGLKGEFCYDGNYLYICTATNVWKRVSITW